LYTFLLWTATWLSFPACIAGSSSTYLMAPFDHRRSHDENVFLLHQRDAFFTQVATMLNGLYARIKSIHDSFFGVAMCSDHSSSSRSLVNHCLQFSGRDCASSTLSISLKTPPVAQTLMNLAPLRSCKRIIRIQSSTPSQTAKARP
jgi:hypothetical protein